MKTEKYISYIIPFYNINIKYLDECLKSIEDQKEVEYEIILINDGSTKKDIDEYCQDICKNNEKIIYIKQNNLGVSSARNKGIEKAQGKYIFFIDADDKLKSNFIEEFLKLELQDEQIIIFDYAFLYADSEKRESLKVENNISDKKVQLISNVLYNFNEFENYMFGSVWSKCFLREFLNENKIRFKSNLHNAEDRMFMIETLDKVEVIKYYPIFCYKYRINNESVSHNINYKVIEYYENFYKEVNEFLKKTEYNKIHVRKYLEYSIINEMLQLIYFNLNYKENYLDKRKRILELFNKFNLKNSIDTISYKDINSTKGKIKLFCFKHQLIMLLNIIFVSKQKKELKKIVKKR